MEEIPHNTTYFYGKVAKAVNILATDEGDIKRRLLLAGESMFLVPPDGVPANVREDIVWIHEQLTRFDPVGSEGRLHATVRRIRRKTCSKIADRIMDVYYKLREYLG